MITTIIIAVLGLIGLVILVAGIRFNDGIDDIRIPRIVGLIPLIIAGVILAVSCTTVVQAKQVGVVTTFGKPTGTLDSGLHVKAPWQKVTQIDGTVQTDKYHGDDSIQVLLADGNTANISATIRWRVNGDNVDRIFADYRSDDPTENLRDAVVSSQFKAVLNEVFGNYDPLAGVNGDGSFAPAYADLNQKITTLMNERIANDGHPLVGIDSITVSYIALNEKTQAKINEFQQEIAKTKIAEQAQRTAKAQAEANRILSDSISNDPNVLVAKCFDLLSDGFTPAAGFSCWPGGNGAVVVPSK